MAAAVVHFVGDSAQGGPIGWRGSGWRCFSGACPCPPGGPSGERLSLGKLAMTPSILFLSVQLANFYLYPINSPYLVCVLGTSSPGAGLLLSSPGVSV